jgi:XTP/dITP diphosphohydrolase
MRLILGTRNAKKRDELRALLHDLPIELDDLRSYPHLSDVEETGATFLANAELKATQVAVQVREWVLAEDSGLVVPALGGRPGVRSARYAGDHDDEANNRKLLAEIGALPNTPTLRAAYYVCVGVLADPHGQVQAGAEGRCHGQILSERRGTGGFGYDPLFYVPELNATFGELSARVKHALSHRGRMLAQLRPRLRALTGTNTSAGMPERR